MTLRDYLEILARRKWAISLTFALVMAVAIIGTLMTTPTYQASTTLRVLTTGGGAGAEYVTYNASQWGRLMNTYAEFATSRPVMNELAKRLQLTKWPQIQVEILNDTELFRITAETLDPVVARDSANTLAEILIAQSRSLYSGSGKTAQEILGEQMEQVKIELDQVWADYESVLADSPDDEEAIAAAKQLVELKESTYGSLLEQYENNRIREALLANTLSVVEPAITPQTPAKPRRQLNLALGLVVGLVGGVGLAFLIENLDTTLYSSEQIKRVVPLPILGKVPAGSRGEQITLFDSNSSQAEAFRRLRTNLLILDHDTRLHTVLVTSADPREGKSTIVANLACSLAQAGRKVLVVDAHLRLPSLHKAFDLANRVGLSSVLEGKASVEEAIQNSAVVGVSVLTSGPIPPNPAELLSSPQMATTIGQLAQRFDMVLLDTPSLLAVIDAAAVARAVDGVLLVIARSEARQEAVRAAYQQLLEVKANSVGVVVNRSEQESGYSYYQRTPTKSGS